MRALERALKLNQTIDIQLARDIDSMALEDVIAAINEAERQIDENFARRAVDEIIYFTFVAGEKRISEKVFFAGRRPLPGAKDALRRLIEKYASDPENTDIYYEPGTVALGHAALALARLDASAGPLIRRYGALIDGEHEGFYPMAILPAFFKTHGWSDAAIELGIIEIERNGSPQFNDYSMIWCDWGMGAAVAAAMTPQDFAARLVSDVQADRCMSEDDMYWFYGFAHKFQRKTAICRNPLPCLDEGVFRRGPNGAAYSRFLCRPRRPRRRRRRRIRTTSAIGKNWNGARRGFVAFMQQRCIKASPSAP
ncbi:MAG: hypothetical protein HZY79_12410 [Rhodoblastus sp.]|nr:MAG: hypothetical protein HZY79_12410 [Rhodoblastus sp.]